MIKHALGRVQRHRAFIGFHRFHHPPHGVVRRQNDHPIVARVRYVQGLLAVDIQIPDRIERADPQRVPVEKAAGHIGVGRGDRAAPPVVIISRRRLEAGHEKHGGRQQANDTLIHRLSPFSGE